MSTSEKRPYAQAWKDAQDFLALLDGTCEKIVVAGSLRRFRPEIGDVELVAIPKVEKRADPASVFGEEHDVNLLWARVDELLHTEKITKHLYGEGEKKQFRWGEKYRGMDWRGFNVEIFCGDRLNFGSVLGIRTGPAAYSQMLVTKLLKSGRLRQQDGYVKYVRDGAIYGVPTEEDFFKACGVAWVEPKVRV
jgi:DNA polymerase/3'-5' exonuclease PolX